MSELSLSAYTMETDFPDGQTVLFNTLSQSICLVDREVWNRIRTFDGYPARQAYELKVRGFLVENGLDEAAVLAHCRLALVHDFNHLTYYIQMGPSPADPLFNQSPFPGGMTRQTARQVLQFLINDLETKRPLSVEVTLSGPDSLSSPRSLNHLAEALYLFCRGQHFDFKFKLLVYGSELKSDQVLGLKPFGLTGIRMVIQPAGSTDDPSIPGRLMSQITALSGMIGLDLEIGYDARSDRQDRLTGLLDHLSDRGLQSALNGLRIFPVNSHQPPPVPPFHPFPECTCQGHVANELVLAGELARRGFSCPDGPPRRRCPARYRSTIMIEPDGRISACPCLSHRPELDQGHIGQGIDIRKESLIKLQSVPARCRPCQALPLCDGGCQGVILGQPDFTGTNGCPNPDLPTVLQEYVTRQSTRI